jgi:hypothetical protein
MPQPAPPKEALALQPLASAPFADDGFLPAYAELHCRSNFSFLVGASHPGELVARAAQQGYSAIAITDECSVAGVVRAHEEARRQREAGSPIRLLIGSHFELQAAGGVPATVWRSVRADHPGPPQRTQRPVLTHGERLAGNASLPWLVDPAPNGQHTRFAPAGDLGE